MNSNSPSGESEFEGVNPATGLVLYYELKEASQATPLHLEIFDAEGNLVNSFHSESDPDYKSYEGAPSSPKTLMNRKGLNRFVWDLRHTSLPGAPEVYIEASYRGHKAIPGTYTFRLQQGTAKWETQAQIIPNPEIPLTSSQYKAYDDFMKKGEATYTAMTEQTNSLYSIQKQLEKLLITLEKQADNKLYQEGRTLLNSLKAWDSKMVQRLSKAYDDVENYENGFTAHYITVLNQVDSAVPKITAGAISRIAELNKQWEGLQKEAVTITDELIPAFNKACFEMGIGVLMMPSS